LIQSEQFLGRDWVIGANADISKTPRHPIEIGVERHRRKRRIVLHDRSHL
jgi:hypothetical protein